MTQPAVVEPIPLRWPVSSEDNSGPALTRLALSRVAGLSQRERGMDLFLKTHLNMVWKPQRGRAGNESPT